MQRQPFFVSLEISIFILRQNWQKKGKKPFIHTYEWNFLKEENKNERKFNFSVAGRVPKVEKI